MSDEVNVVAEMNEYLGEHQHKSVPYVGGLDIVRVTCEQLSVWRNHVERLQAKEAKLVALGKKWQAESGKRKTNEPSGAQAAARHINVMAHTQLLTLLNPPQGDTL